jgi:hypothetical protein
LAELLVETVVTVEVIVEEEEDEEVEGEYVELPSPEQAREYKAFIMKGGTNSSRRPE